MKDGVYIRTIVCKDGALYEGKIIPMEEFMNDVTKKLVELTIGGLEERTFGEKKDA